MCVCNMHFYIQNHFLLKHYITKKKWFRAIFLFWEPAKLLLQPTSWNQQFQQDGNLLWKYEYHLLIKPQCEGE